MMKITYLSILSVFGLAVLTLTGCFPDNDSSYDGPLQVEFRPVEQTLDLSEETSYSANIQLIGPHQETAISVNYEVDAELTTAVRGEHYELDGNSTQIPANSSFAAIQITADPDAFGDESVQLVIHLLGDDTGEVKVAQNYRTFTLSIEP